MTQSEMPEGLESSGKRLWTSITDDFELDVHEQMLLTQACRCADRLDRLAAEEATSEVTSINARGDLVPHAALVEARQQSLTLARLLASMRLPSGETEERPSRRNAGGARGTYRKYGNANLSRSA